MTVVAVAARRVDPRGRAIVASLLATALVLPASAALERAVVGHTTFDAAAIAEAVSHRARPEAGGYAVHDAVYEARFDESGVTIGGVTLAASGATGAWRADGNVLSRPLGVGRVERVTAREGNVEWDVILTRAALGNVHVDARLTGVDGAAQRSGDEWRLPVGAASLRVGALVVRDRDGRALLRRAVTVNGDRLALDVPAAALRGARYPVVLDPTVSPERRVAEPTNVVAARDQSSPRIAFGAGEFFAVWEDTRRPAGCVMGCAHDIWGARIAANGRLLDPTGIAISLGPGEQEEPSIAWTGSHFVVAWRDRRSGTGPGQIFAARVKADGTVLDPDGMSIAPAPSVEQFDPVVAGAAGRALIVWQESTDLDSNVRGVRMDASGTVLDRPPLPLAASSADQELPTVASDNAGYVVAWREARPSGGTDVRAERVRLNGSIGSPTWVSNSGEADAPAVAASGTDFLVAWSDTGADFLGDVLAARLTLDARLVDGRTIPVGVASGMQSGASVTWAGSTYVAAWQDERAGFSTDVFIRRVGADGTMRESNARRVSPPAGVQLFPATAGGNGNAYVVWHDGSDGFDIFGTRVDVTTGAAPDAPGVALSRAANQQTCSSVASGSGVFLVVWQDNQPGRDAAEVRASRVKPDGTLLDPKGLRLGATGHDQQCPRVAYGGGQFLVAWEDTRGVSIDIYATRVAPDGSILDPSGIPVSTASGNQTAPAIAWDGDRFLVAWEDARGGSTDVRAARVGPGGTVLDPSGILVVAASGGQGTPAVAGIRNGWEVVWRDDRTIADTGSDIYGTQVSDAGVVAHPGGNPLAHTTHIEQLPAVASNASGVLVVWRDADAHQIRSVRLSTGGTAAGAKPIDVAAAATDESEPTVASCGGSFTVVWQQIDHGADWNVRGARVAGNGAVISGSGFSVAGGTQAETSPVIASLPGGTFGVVYQRFAALAPLSAQRTFLRTIGP